MNVFYINLSPLTRAFRSKNYRLFFTGQGLSLIGTWMTQIATIWLVYHLTNSALWLGVVSFAGQVPTFLLSPFAGVIVDRLPRRRMLLWTQFLAMLQSLTLAVLALMGAIALWQIVVLSIFQGLINAFDAPARQAFVAEIIENPEDFGNAIALNSSMMSSARLIGPAVGGIIVATMGTGACFLLDGISYLAVIYMLTAMRLQPQRIAIADVKPIQKLREGFIYAFGFPPIRKILLLLALVSFFGTSYIALGPVFATETLHGGADTLGFLMAASGLGALIAGIYLSARKNVMGLGKVIAIAPAILGIGLIGFSLSRILWLSLLLMLPIGFGLILQAASSNALLQTIVEDDKRGRVMSLYIMAFMGMVPFGNLFAGALASKIGVPATLFIDGIICIASAFYFVRQLPSFRPFIHPIYTRIGLLPRS